MFYAYFYDDSLFFFFTSSLFLVSFAVALKDDAHGCHSAWRDEGRWPLSSQWLAEVASFSEIYRRLRTRGFTVSIDVPKFQMCLARLSNWYPKTPTGVRIFLSSNSRLVQDRAVWFSLISVENESFAAILAGSPENVTDSNGK